MSISAQLKFWRTSAAKTLGAVVALALGASTLVASPAGAVGNDVRVYGWATGANSALVCVDFYEGHAIPGYATEEYHSNNGLAFGLSIDTENSSVDADAEIVEVEPTNGCDVEYTVTEIVTGETTHFRYDAWLIDINGEEDGAGSGTTANETGEFGHFGVWIDDLKTSVGLAYQNDQISDERHTAYLCVAAADATEVDGVRDEYVLADLPIVTVYDETAGEWVTEEVSVYVYNTEELADPSCSGEYPVEAYVGDLELGHTYSFFAQAITSHSVYVDSEGWVLDYIHEHWSYTSSTEFTPLDVTQNQVSIFPTHNNGWNGPEHAGVSGLYLNAGEGGDYWNDIVRGDGPSYNSVLSGEGIADLNYANVEVATPVSFVEGEEETNDDRYNTWGNFSVYDRDGLVDYAAEHTLLDLNGGCVVEYCGYDLTTDYGTESAGRWGNLPQFDGQAYVEGVVADNGGVFQGLSDSYSERREFDTFYGNRVRATGDDSLEITLETNISTDVDGYVDPTDATYTVRALPNYGDGTNINGNVADMQYTGNQDAQRPVRKNAIDFTFEPGDYGVVECLVDGEDECSDLGAVVFELDGLDAGTSYSFEVIATFPVNDSMDSNTDRVAGDGGYETVQIRDSVYWYGTTYYESDVINVTNNSAEYIINLSDSHFADNAALLTAGYVGVNKCVWNPEIGGTSSGDAEDPNWDCSAVEDENDTYTSRRFATEETSRQSVSTRFIGGQLYAVVSLTGLDADTKYEVVFGNDYYYTTLPSLADPFEFSNRQIFVDTLDGDYCDALSFGYNAEEFADETDNGTDCYNSTVNNRIFRTAVEAFVTVENEAPVVIDSAIYIGEENTIGEVWFPGDEGVSVNEPTVGFLFSEDVYMNGIGKNITLRNRDSGELTVIPLSSADVNIYTSEGGFYSILEVKLPSLEYETQYELEIPAGALVDAAGNEFAGVRAVDFGFTTESTDTVAPEVIDISPADGSVDVSVDADLEITFDENIYKGGNKNYIRIFNADTDNQVVSINVTSSKVAIDGNVAYVALPTLAFGTNYYVIVDEAAFEDYNGNESDGVNGDEARFTTEYNLPPVLESITPADLAFDVDVNSDITLVFNEDVFKGKTGKYIKIWNADTDKIAVVIDVTSAKVTGAGDTWQVALPTLDFDTNYYWTIDVGAFVDSVGNQFEGLNGSDARFKTIATDVIAPVVVSTTPADGDVNVDVNADLTLEFSEPVVKGSVGKTIKVWNSSTGMVVATIDVTSSLVDVNGSTVTVVLPKLGFSTDYHVTVDPGAFYDVNGNAFEGLAGSALDFQTESTDTEAPVLTAIGTVDADENGVDTTTDFILTFSEDVTPGSAPIQLIRAKDDVVIQTFIPSASKAVTVNGNVVTISRNLWLTYSTDYYLYVPRGSFVDDAGNAFQGNDNATVTFTTEDKPAFVGIINVSASDNGVRDFTVNMGEAFAYSAYSVWRKERYTGLLREVWKGTLDAQGRASFTKDVDHLQRLDDVFVYIGRHALAYERVQTA